MASDENLRIERLSLGPYGTNAYVLTCLSTRESAVVDAPGEADKIAGALEGTTPRYILLTHDHADHTGALEELRRKVDVPLVAHELDSRKLAKPPEIPAKDGDSLKLGDIELEVLHTPGHTPGSLCFRAGKYLLAGDTIFPGGPGKTASPEAFRQIIESITERVLALPDDTGIYPGHGDPTTVGLSREEYRVFSSRSHSPDLCGDVLWLSS